ncbi:MAG TPA: translation initiation factor IF-2 N-terminal domain-containing protein, partial [Jatrophihabitantaceae bacterium]|nr:translation initiation factor IF-2 N-terminal domain-containing protein [Jatrophihabitantaceae bacterium]
MPGKVRVSALAKEIGITSKEALAKLTELGEYVKSPSSTVEAPVARRLREAFPDAKPAEPAPAKKAPAKKAAAKAAPAAPVEPEPPVVPVDVAAQPAPVAEAPIAPA